MRHVALYLYILLYTFPNSVETEILLDSYQDPFSSDCECDDDDDSNDENNWRNEYPDSEQSSIELEDMINAMANVDMGKTYIQTLILDINMALLTRLLNIKFL